MRRLRLALIGFVVAVSSVAAEEPDNLQETQPRWFAVLIAECADILDPRIKDVLDEARRRKIVQPFSREWCIRQNIFPEPKGAKSES